jgi:hypothetical protein
MSEAIASGSQLRCYLKFMESRRELENGKARDFEGGTDRTSTPYVGHVEGITIALGGQGIVTPGCEIAASASQSLNVCDTLLESSARDFGSRCWSQVIRGAFVGLSRRYLSSWSCLPCLSWPPSRSRSWSEWWSCSTRPRFPSQ